MKHDVIIFGGLAGVVGNIFKEVISWGFYFSGLINYTYDHFCAGLVVNPAGYVKMLFAVFIGTMIDFTVAAVFGVIMYFVMRKTGTQYWLFKGLGFGMVIFLICFAVLRPTFSIKIESTPLQALMYMIPNLVYGVITCWFLKKYGVYK
jgi:hypothetical protein